MFELRVMFEDKKPFTVEASRSFAILEEKARKGKLLKGIESVEIINLNPPESGRDAQKGR